MCGITGILRPKSEDTIIQMTDAILHRGPDEDGYFSDDLVSLGMRRLSIIDLSSGQQPIESGDGRFLIFFNGEVYNYKELRDELISKGRVFKTESDTETILQMFEEYGVESFSRLRGMFAFSIYDKEKNTLVLVRDFFGIKPLYYLSSASGGVEAFSSEIKSFYSLPSFKPEVNDEAVFNYLSYQYNPLEETFFKGVRKLQPGHYMVVNAKTGESQVEKYWQFEFDQDNDLDEVKTAQEIKLVLEDSVRYHMIADVPVGSFLSGGIDSSIIATLAQKAKGDEKLKTFTVGFDTLTEGLESRETAEPLGTEHKEITIGPKEYFEALPKAVWHFDEPVADPSALGLYFLAREARKEVKVVMSGEGADELFGGYNIYLEAFARKKLDWLPVAVWRTISRVPFNFRGKNFAKRLSQNLEDRYIGNASIFNQEEVAKLWDAPLVPRTTLKTLYNEVEGLSDSTKMQYIDIHTWLVGDILAKADKMTMAHSLELRVPFLDRKVADLARTLPDKFKWRGKVTKYLLREAFRDVLPESTRTRRKLGFPTPVRDWFRDPELKMLDGIVENEYIKSYFNTTEITQLIEEHRAGKRDNSRKLYLLLMLSIWYNIFIERKPI